MKPQLVLVKLKQDDKRDSRHGGGGESKVSLPCLLPTKKLVTSLFVNTA